MLAAMIVEHDRGDDDVAAALRLQEPAGMKAQAAPNRPAPTTATGMVTYHGT